MFRRCNKSRASAKANAREDRVLEAFYPAAEAAVDEPSNTRESSKHSGIQTSDGSMGSSISTRTSHFRPSIKKKDRKKMSVGESFRQLSRGGSIRSIFSDKSRRSKASTGRLSKSRSSHALLENEIDMSYPKARDAPGASAVTSSAEMDIPLNGISESDERQSEDVAPPSPAFLTKSRNARRDLKPAKSLSHLPTDCVTLDASDKLKKSESVRQTMTKTIPEDFREITLANGPQDTPSPNEQEDKLDTSTIGSEDEMDFDDESFCEEATVYGSVAQVSVHARSRYAHYVTSDNESLQSDAVSSKPDGSKAHSASESTSRFDESTTNSISDISSKLESMPSVVLSGSGSQHGYDDVEEKKASPDGMATPTSQSESYSVVSLSFLSPNVPADVAKRVFSEAMRITRSGGLIYVVDLEGQTVHNVDEMKELLSPVSLDDQEDAQQPKYFKDSTGFKEYEITRWMAIKQ